MTNICPGKLGSMGQAVYCRYRQVAVFLLVSKTMIV